ncbi:DUF2202 domain-containing protein [Demequina mangrovi]|uniref:DUF2202 domain-containing protein n=1 Tax=Demequina mangrovi TaxID=1043493 RepID=A0A1H7AR67_9MICO|nr:DUF2202 domain-containing protein [Demequina mangrovi]SEJ66367.1 hypothetical protein SAMN05421637_2596 [Demequina mangrovi]
MTTWTRIAWGAAAGAALIAGTAGAAWAASSGSGDDDDSTYGYERGYGMGGGMGGMMRGRSWDDDADARDWRGAGGCLGDVHVDDAPATDADAASLAAMAEEERMAGDLYDALADTTGLRTFAMIAHAEDMHLAAVQGLLEAYGLDDPSEDAEPGVYDDADLQALYDELLAQGTASETGALTAGALVEETDIADLRAQDVDSEAIAALYDRLEHASEHHLTAFVRALDADGQAYEASFLDPAEVADITGVPAP